MASEQEKPPKPKKGVGFRSRDSIEQVRRISRFSNYSIDEAEAYWGDGSEHKLRKQELRETVQEWQRGRRMSDNLTFTTKGIADKVGPGKILKKENRAVSRQAVLDEQELQEVEGAQDDELLADIYGVTTVRAKNKARHEALEMAEEVKKLNIEENS